MKRKFHINGNEISLSNLCIEEETISFLMDGNRYQFEVFSTDNGYKMLMDDGKRYHLFVGKTAVQAKRHIFIDGKEAFISPVLRGRACKDDVQGNFISPMPGKIVQVHVKSGEEVSKGQPVITIEAMKLQHTLYAPDDGVVEKICYEIGAQVQEGILLVEFKNTDPSRPDS